MQIFRDSSIVGRINKLTELLRIKFNDKFKNELDQLSFSDIIVLNCQNFNPFIRFECSGFPCYLISAEVAFQEYFSDIFKDIFVIKDFDMSILDIDIYFKITEKLFSDDFLKVINLFKNLKDNSVLQISLEDNTKIEIPYYHNNTWEFDLVGNNLCYPTLKGNIFTYHIVAFLDIKEITFNAVPTKSA